MSTINSAVTPTRNDIEALIELSSGFLEPGFGPVVEWKTVESDASGVKQLPFPVYDVRVQAFFQTLSQPCWIDPAYLENAEPFVEKPESLSEASLVEIRSVLTWCSPGERFCEGHWQSVIEDGMIGDCMQRLEALLEAEK